jgi:transposase-like protein
MGLSRRQFTKEFKLAATQRLERGASVAAVARAFEINPNVLPRWRREFRQGPGNAFPGLGKRRWERAGSPHWSARLASRGWRSIS